MDEEDGGGRGGGGGGRGDLCLCVLQPDLSNHAR